MDDWLSDLPRHLSYSFIWWLLLEAAKQAYHNRKQLIRRGKSISVLVADTVGVSDTTTHALRGAVQGGGSMSGKLSVGPPKKRSAAEEIFWWYWRIHLS